MQDYYNTVPTFGVGGLIAKIAKAAGRAKIQGHANLLSKAQPELSKLLGKLARSQKGGPKLSEEESKKLASLAQEYRRGNINYQNRRAKINEQIAAPAKPAEQPKPNSGTTLSARWKQARQWMNNHPKSVVGGALFLGSGTGRDVLGKVASLYNARPFTQLPTTKQQDFVTINGVKIPITKSPNGGFVPVQTQPSAPAQTTPTGAGDDRDSLINNANANTPQPPAQGNPQGDSQVPDQQTINDLFADDTDQWY